MICLVFIARELMKRREFEITCPAAISAKNRRLRRRGLMYPVRYLVFPLAVRSYCVCQHCLRRRDAQYALSIRAKRT